MVSPIRRQLMTVRRSELTSSHSDLSVEMAPVRPRILVGQRTREHLLAAILMIVVLSIFYRDIVFGGHTFLLLNAASGTLPTSMGSAYGYPGTKSQLPVLDPVNAWLSEPYQRRIGKILANGEVPLWNP